MHQVIGHPDVVSHTHAQKFGGYIFEEIGARFESACAYTHACTRTHKSARDIAPHTLTCAYGHIH